MRKEEHQKDPVPGHGQDDTHRPQQEAEDAEEFDTHVECGCHDDGKQSDTVADQPGFQIFPQEQAGGQNHEQNSRLPELVLPQSYGTPGGQYHADSGHRHQVKQCQQDPEDQEIGISDGKQTQTAQGGQDHGDESLRSQISKP